MNRTVYTRHRIMGSYPAPQPHSYAPNSFDTPWPIYEVITSHSSPRSASFPVQQTVVLDDAIDDRWINLGRTQVVPDSYPRVADQTRRDVSTHQAPSKLTQEVRQNKAVKKLKKEFYTPKPKRGALRLYYREKPSNNINGKEKEKDDEEVKRCPICLEDFKREEVLVTPCKHMFHEECIVPWVNNHGSCPVCRFGPIFTMDDE